MLLATVTLQEPMKFDELQSMFSEFELTRPKNISTFLDVKKIAEIDDVIGESCISFNAITNPLNEIKKQLFS